MEDLLANDWSHGSGRIHFSLLWNCKNWRNSLILLFILEGEVASFCIVCEKRKSKIDQFTSLSESEHSSTRFDCVKWYNFISFSLSVGENDEIFKQKKQTFHMKWSEILFLNRQENFLSARKMDKYFHNKRKQRTKQWKRSSALSDGRPEHKIHRLHVKLKNIIMKIKSE